MGVSSIDRWLIDKGFQPIVDFTQREPHWLAEQSAITMAILNIMDIAFGGSAFRQGINVLISAFFVVFARITRGHPDVSIPFVRKFMFAFSVIVIMLVGVSFESAEQVVGIGNNFCFTAYWYFLACKKPRPRVPRGTLAGGAA